MHYSLRTLLIAVSLGPPAIAVVWFAGWYLLLLASVLVLGLLWVLLSYALANLFADIFCSVMR